jgi:sec-independent protein translocase protein TatB
MFGIGFSEIVLIALVAIIFIRPDDLPAALRRAGRAYGKIKKTVNEFTEFKNAFMKQVEEVARIEADKPDPSAEKQALPSPGSEAPKVEASETAASNTAASISSDESSQPQA